MRFPSPLSPLPNIIFYINLSSCKTVVISCIINFLHKSDDALPTNLRYLVYLQLLLNIDDINIIF